MRQQYGLRIQGEEFRNMSWDEFTDLLAGLNDSTPLVKVAVIRTESNPEALKNYTASQRAMRAEWQRKQALKRSPESRDSFLETVQKAFEEMFHE